MADSPVYDHVAFGLRWRSDVLLEPFERSTEIDLPPHIHVARSSGPMSERPVPSGGRNVSRASDGVRYTAGSIATIDTFGADRIEVHPGAQWENQLPPPFFGTLTGLLLAWRGLVPLHGTAVELDGRGVLVCGPGGAGKSTLAAALIAQGARLISDDLSVLHPGPPGSPPFLFAGRRTLRLFHSTAELLGQAVPWTAPPRVADRKLAVSPPAVNASVGVPLETVIVLGGSGPVSSRAEKAEILGRQFFRPRWLPTLPGHRMRLAVLAFACGDLEVLRMAPVEVRDQASFAEVARRAMQVLREQRNPRSGLSHSN